MAQARPPSRGGFTPVHFWMIGFVFLWLASTVLLVLLYTDQEGLQTRITALETENSKLVRSGDKNLPWYSKADARGDSMAKLCEDARMQIAKLAVGPDAQAGEDYETVKNRVTPLTNQIINDGFVEETAAFESVEMLPALTVLYESFKSERSLRMSAQERAAQLEQDLQANVQSLETLRSDFDTASDRLNKQVAKMEADRSDYAATRDSEVDEFERGLEEKRQEFSRDLQEQRNIAQEERQRLEELQVRFAEIRAKLGELQITPGENLTARQADGQVIFAPKGGNMVSINLGQAHQLTPGLQFAVYPYTGIPADGQAKARIEVTRIDDTTAECRIVAIDRTEVVIEGDLVANPVYDPQRPLRFHVVGDFDLDGDGVDDPDGGARIGGLISNWGGEVLDELSTRVDFLVLGYTPEVPKFLTGDPSRRRDPGQSERERQYEEQLDQYEQAVTTANDLSIPILTQDMLASFLGY